MMELFHYHHWTNHLEELEAFYVENGFHVAGRFAKIKDGIKTYHPPLSWDDFREENPTFRIIEVRKGKVNVSFGAGKKTMFDHIGFLVSKEEYDEICMRAKQLGFNVSEGDRRTFIGTPSRLRIELQQREDVVEEGNDHITSMEITVKDEAHIKDFVNLLGEYVSNIHFAVGENLQLNKVTIVGRDNKKAMDPIGVEVDLV